MSRKERLKVKWGIETEFQFWIIMIVFSIAGTNTVMVRRPIFDWLGVTNDTNGFLWFLLWLAVIFPAYQVLLLFWGTVFGQFRFFWAFEQKMWRRMGLIGPKE